jgi:hypothetical protein
LAGGTTNLASVSFGPPAWRPPALLLAALAATACGFLIPEVWALAVVLLGAAVRDWRCRPALVLGDEGFSYVSGLRRQAATWLVVEAVRVRQERHFLAFGRNLEIDLSDDTLIVLSRAQLGAEPDGVAAEVEKAWQRAVRSAKRS